MDNAFATKIRERAYAFWLAEGMCDGAAERHWLQAEDIVRQETVIPAATASAAKAAKRVAAKKSLVGPAKSKPSVTSTKATKSSKAKKSAADASPEAMPKRRVKPVVPGVAEATA